MKRIKLRGLVISPLANGEKWITSDEEYHEVYINYVEKSAYINGHAVDFQSISQYTGRKDREGKEIYVGHVLKGKDESHKGVYIVVFKDDSFIAEYHFNIRGYDEVTDVPLRNITKYGKIIGNIYENPKLI